MGQKLGYSPSSAIVVFSLPVYSLTISFITSTSGSSLKRQWSEPTGTPFTTLSIWKTRFESSIYFLIHTSTGYPKLAFESPEFGSPYHVKTSKHNGNEPSSACATNKVEILTWKRGFTFSVQTLNLVHELLKYEKRGESSHATSIECKDSRNVLHFRAVDYY